MVGPRLHPFHVGEGQRALRFVERRLVRVALEQLGDLALAGRDDHEVGIAGVCLKIPHARFQDFEPSAAFRKLIRPARLIPFLVSRPFQSIAFLPPDGAGTVN
jgi:hypothetical protein